MIVKQVLMSVFFMKPPLFTAYNFQKDFIRYIKTLQRDPDTLYIYGSIVNLIDLSFLQCKSLKKLNPGNHELGLNESFLDDQTTSFFFIEIIKKLSSSTSVFPSLRTRI